MLSSETLIASKIQQIKHKGRQTQFYINFSLCLRERRFSILLEESVRIIEKWLAYLQNILSLYDFTACKGTINGGF